jgi:Holliday junction resolvase RusA-like endonuclease
VGAQRWEGGPESVLTNPFLNLVSEFELTIEGRSQTKQRPRFVHGRVINPPSNIINENDVRSVWREAGSPRLPRGVALGVEMCILVVRPQGHFKKDGSLSAEGQRNPHPANKKPDIDNALKLIFDALNTRAWHDDVAFTRALVERDWGEWPETRLRVYTIEEE